MSLLHDVPGSFLSQTEAWQLLCKTGKAVGEEQETL